MFDKLLKLLKIKLEGELTLKDGTPVVLDGEMELGVSIMVQATDGKLMDLPDGSYELSSGEIITVEKGLVIDIVEEVVNKPSPDPGMNYPHGHGPMENHPPEMDHYAIDPELTPVSDTGDGETTTGKTDKKENMAMTPEELQKLIEELTARITALEEKIAALEGGTETKPAPEGDIKAGPDTNMLSAIEKLQSDVEIIMSKANFSKEIPKIEIENPKDSRIEILKQYRRK